MDKLQKTKKLKYKGQQLYSKINEIEVRLNNNDTLINQGLMSESVVYWKQRKRSRDDLSDFEENI